MKILNSKHQISPYRACGVVGRAHGNKFQLNPFRVCGDVGRAHENTKFKTNLSLRFRILRLNKGG